MSVDQKLTFCFQRNVKLQILFENGLFYMEAHFAASQFTHELTQVMKSDFFLFILVGKKLDFANAMQMQNDFWVM